MAGGRLNHFRTPGVIALCAYFWRAHTTQKLLAAEENLQPRETASHNTKVLPMKNVRDVVSVDYIVDR